MQLIVKLAIFNVPYAKELEREVCRVRLKCILLETCKKYICTINTHRLMKKASKNIWHRGVLGPFLIVSFGADVPQSTEVQINDSLREL